MTPVILRLFYRCQWAVGSLGFYWFFLHPPHFPLWLEFGRLSRTGAMLQALTFRAREGGGARRRGKREIESERCHWQLQGNALHEC